MPKRHQIRDIASGIAADCRWALAYPGFRRLTYAIAILSFAVLCIGAIGGVLRSSKLITEDGSEWFSIGRDGSIVETLGYVDFGTSALMLLLIFLKTRMRLAAFLAVLVAYLLIDDMYLLHDRARLLIGNAIGYRNQVISMQDLGEAIFAFIVFVIVAAVFAVMARTFKKGEVKAFLPVILPIVLFLSLAVGFDQLHQILIKILGISKLKNNFFTLFEDGGEMLAQGLTVLGAALVYLKYSAPGGAAAPSTLPEVGE